MIELTLLCFAVIAFPLVYLRLVGINLTATSLFFGALWLVYGVGYLVFSRLFGPGVLQALFAQEQEQAQKLFLMCAREVGQYTFILQTSINQGIISTFDLAIGIMFVGLITGCVLCDKILGNTPEGLHAAMREWSQEKERVAYRPSNRLLTLSLTAILTFMIYFLVRDDQLTKVWMYFASQAGEFEKIAMRQAYGGSTSYFFNLMLATFLPFICFYLVALEKRRSYVLWTFTIALVGLVILAKLAMLSKAPVVVFLAQVCLIVPLQKSVRISMSTLWIGMIAFGSLMLMIVTANPDLEGLEAVEFLLYRLFIAPNEALLEYFASIPNFIPHTGGFDNRFFAYFVKSPLLEATHFRVSELYRGVKGYSTNTMFLGDAWAQFGWIGALTGSVLAGFIFRWVDTLIIVVQKKSPLAIAGLLLAYFGAFTALSTALQTALLTGGLLMVIALMWAFSRTTVRALGNASP